MGYMESQTPSWVFFLIRNNRLPFKTKNTSRHSASWLLSNCSGNEVRLAVSPVPAWAIELDAVSKQINSITLPIVLQGLAFNAIYFDK